ncbi:MAG TPA: anthranilate phosphoribosyltransferase [Phycisphaerales bacterium]|nr:anthranilate phosphoribosyltransferase [Phycisphaerales bacterium]
MQSILRTLMEGRSLDEREAERAFDLILRGEANESQVGAMLALLARKRPSLDEIVGGARAMRARATAVPIDGPDAPAIRARLIDTCGTGGTAKTFNISTAAAVVAAAARGPNGERVYVAKHGGRSRSGRGSAEVLSLLGVNVDAAPETQTKCLREAGVCFSFAVNHHPAMKFAAGARKSLGFPTIFNVLGPLTNPAGARRQVMGVYDRALVPLVAEAMARLGAEDALVVHGLDGMDEISTTGPTIAARVRDGRVAHEEISVADLGMPAARIEDLVVDSVDRAADTIRGILAREAGAARDIVVVNAGAALMIGGVADNLRIAADLAARAIDSGEASRTLEALARISRG